VSVHWNSAMTISETLIHEVLSLTEGLLATTFSHLSVSHVVLNPFNIANISDVHPFQITL